MKTDQLSSKHNHINVGSLTDDPKFMAAFQEAIKDPELRKEIISVLEAAGLLPLSVRRPA